MGSTLKHINTSQHLYHLRHIPKGLSRIEGNKSNPDMTCVDTHLGGGINQYIITMYYIILTWGSVTSYPYLKLELSETKTRSEKNGPRMVESSASLHPTSEWAHFCVWKNSFVFDVSPGKSGYRVASATVFQQLR